MYIAQFPGQESIWKLCKVEQLVPGRDGSVRSAKVSVLTNGSKKQFLRSIKHLIPLEIRPVVKRVAEHVTRDVAKET